MVDAYLARGVERGQRVGALDGARAAVTDALECHASEDTRGGGVLPSGAER
jgi:hypothetical protein